METFANVFDMLIQVFSSLRNLDNFEAVSSLDEISRDLRQNFSNRRLEEAVVSIAMVGANRLKNLQLRKNFILELRVPGIRC